MSVVNSVTNLTTRVDVKKTAITYGSIAAIRLLLSRQLLINQHDVASGYLCDPGDCLCPLSILLGASFLSYAIPMDLRFEKDGG